MVNHSEATHRLYIISAAIWRPCQRVRGSWVAPALLAMALALGIESQASGQSPDGWTLRVERGELRYDTRTGRIDVSGRISARPTSGGSLGGAVEGSITIAEGTVQAQGTAFAVVGGISVPVARIRWPDDAKRLQSGKFVLPPMTFSPFSDVDVRVSDLAIDYDLSEPAQRFKLQGKLAVQQWQGLVIDFSGSREIAYENGELQIHVRVSVDQLVRLGDQWNLGPSFIELDLKRRSFSGGTTWQTPYGSLATLWLK